MSQKRQQTAIIIIVVLLVLIAAVWAINYFGSGTIWAKFYRSDGKEPYDLHVFHELIRAQYTDGNVHALTENFDQNWIPVSDEATDYLFIGRALLLPDHEVDSLLNIVARGNEAFIIAKYVSPYLTENLIGRFDLYTDYESKPETEISIRMNESDQIFSFENLSRYGKTSHNWNYLAGVEFIEQTIPGYVLGVMEDSLAICMAIPYGKGHFYLHTVPESFGNVHAIYEEKLAYFESFFGYLKGEQLYLDQHRYQGNYGQRSFQFAQEGPFEYILSQQSLRWAWYLLLTLAIIYILFLLKRKQRMVPIIDPHANSSLEFVQVIGRLYFQQQDHLNLGETKMKLFLADVKRRFRIPATHIDDKFYEMVAKKSNLHKKQVSDIFVAYKQLQRAPTAENLIMLNSKLEVFYNQI